MRVKFLRMKQLTALTTANSSLSFAILSRKSLWREMCPTGTKRDRSGLVENTIPFGKRKFGQFKPEFLVEWNAPKEFLKR